jgi:Ca-activated chloride channel family protein
MKNCRSYRKQLTAFLHGELDAQNFQALEKHLADCAACRAELEAQRATLALLGEALTAAPAPAELPAWGLRTQRVRPWIPLDKRLFRIRLISVAVTSCLALFFLICCGSMVVFKTIYAPKMCFCPPPPVNRPKMEPHKLMVKSRPAPTQPVATASLSDHRLAGGLASATMRNSAVPDGFGGELGKGVIGGRDLMPDIQQVAFFGGAVDEKADSLEQVAAPAVVADAEKDKSWSFDDESALIDPATPQSPVQEEVLASKEIVSGQTVGFAARQPKRFEPEPEIKPSEFKPAVFNPYILAAKNAFSTFSIDVDTASYGLVRAGLLNRKIPEPESVRTEEFINSFDYDYRPPAGAQTFAVHNEMAPSPFRPNMDVLKIGVKGRRIGRDDHRGAVLTLVIDTSGSMNTPDRLGLIKESLALLFDQLSPDDEVAIVQFGNGARLVCEHTPASEKATLLNAVETLQAGGPTQFDQGLQLGYEQAIAGFRAGDSNRILILSDGVANLGELDPDAILDQMSELRKKGIYLSVLGFGAGAYDDDLLERLADRGDGTYVYIDTMEEARRLFVGQLAATLHVIAGDVKIQVEFNPERVLRYRQIGYENRQLTKEQFRDDTVDAGEVGSGQSVTALYDVELIPDGPSDKPIATVYVRYRRVDTGAIEEISSRVTDDVRVETFEAAAPRFKVAVCAAEFAEYLRRSPYVAGTGAGDIAERLQPAVQTLDLDAEVKTLNGLISIVDRLER